MYIYIVSFRKWQEANKQRNSKSAQWSNPQLRKQHSYGDLGDLNSDFLSQDTTNLSKVRGNAQATRGFSRTISQEVDWLFP